ncbi:MAG: trimeric intracellular cation channel family protein [Verrucomicrobiae bacterium]|nr:trimeric intracellular cation channel family protein [Verrucomicrobiae bacterium]
MLTITFIECTAVIAAAIFGVLLATRTNMDATGLFAVAFAMAFGGGTVRDLCLDRHPLFWIENSHYTVIVFFIALAASLAPGIVSKFERFLILPDAIGMGLFTVAGADIALDAGTSLFLAVLFGVITGTFGGVLADIICNEIPVLFRPGTPLCATCCFIGAWGFVIALKMELPRPGPAILGFSAVIIARLSAIKWRIALPPINRNRPPAPSEPK